MSPAQIQKSMFLMRAEAEVYVGDGFYRFIPYNYGPFDADIYHDLDGLAAQGLVTSVSSPTVRWKFYAVTAAGLEAADRARAEADPTAVDYLGRVVDWISSLSFPALIRAIYARYPAYRANSVFVG